MLTLFISRRQIFSVLNVTKQSHRVLLILSVITSHLVGCILTGSSCNHSTPYMRQLDRPLDVSTYCLSHVPIHKENFYYSLLLVTQSETWVSLSTYPDYLFKERVSMRVGKWCSYQKSVTPRDTGQFSVPCTISWSTQRTSW